MRLPVRYLLCLLGCVFALPIFSEDKEAEEQLLPSTPEQVATLNSESDYLIGGLISPLSGHPSLRQIDLIVKGAQNIVLSRVYAPPYMPCAFPKYKKQQEEWDKENLYHHLAEYYKGWQFYPHLKLELKGQQVLFTDSNGISLYFTLSTPGGSLSSPLYALSNVAAETPSGKFYARNTFIANIGSEVRVFTPDGTWHIYAKSNRFSSYHFLQKEILPNGKVLRYHYDDTGELQQVESLDPQERFVYACLHVEGSAWHTRHVHFTSSSGQTTDYAYQRRGIHTKLKFKSGHGFKKLKSTREYRYLCPPLLSSISSPIYRHESLGYSDKFLLTSYSGKNVIFNALHQGFGSTESHYRVSELHLPTGSNDTFFPVYNISYDPPVPGNKEGSTTVINSDGTKTVYYFGKNLLIASIQSFDENEILKKEKTYSWNSVHWLGSCEVRDGQKNLLYQKSYQYDRFGNPIVEVFSGDLTGQGDEDSFKITRIFSDEGRNLLLKEMTEDGKTTTFSYVPNTNLVTSKLIRGAEGILLREFSSYDDCHNLIQTVMDDGNAELQEDLSGVTQRTITRYHLRQIPPFLHLPDRIEHMYWEEGVEKPLKTTQFIYDSHGNIAEQRVYDAKGVHRFTICRTYNERGDVLSETNRLGQEASYSYDARGRPAELSPFSKRLHTTFRYDTQGRLLEKREIGDDGVVRVESSEYDPQGRLIEKKDPFQNSTYYDYDLLVNKATRTSLPLTLAENEQMVPSFLFSTYDPLGRELTSSDANGHSKTYRYNAYGSVTQVLYPEGRKEQFLYAKNGYLLSHTDQEGLTIHFKRDLFGRVLEKTFVAADAEIVGVETFTYNGFNLLTETDKEGNTRRYSYDGAGRKIREEFCSKVTEFTYDALGRISVIRQCNGDNTLLTHYRRDLEDRILEETQTDLSGNILHMINYSYDEQGDRKTTTRYICKEESTETFVYDSFRRVILATDAEGYTTQTTYNENHTDLAKQRVLQTRVTDPLHTTIVNTYDALGRIVKKETFNPQGAPIARQEMLYDRGGNLLRRKDDIYENDELLGHQRISYTYTSNNQVASLTRGDQTQEARKTTYTYLSSGKIATKTLPDGVTLFYSYNPLGFLSSLNSSDGKIHHTFEHNRLGHLKYAWDENQNIAIQRETDPFGNVTLEIFPNGLKIKKEYDSFNRLISLTIPSCGEVYYTYDPLFLRAVSRVSPQGELLYAHTYNEYDNGGNLLTESLIGNAGEVTHGTNLRGHKTSLFSPYFSQECSYDPVGNVIDTAIDGATNHYTYDGLSQLSSEHHATYTHDSLYDRTAKNGQPQDTNALNELTSCNDTICSYDLNGNQALKQTSEETLRYTYDPLNQLTQVSSEKQKVNFFYDPLGRRLSKIVYAPSSHGWQEMTRENYLYHGFEEMGAFTAYGESKNLKILGLSKYKNHSVPVSIEIGGHYFAPILDIQGNVRRLVNPTSQTLASRYEFTAFGEELAVQETGFNPWRYASKRLDPELGLIYFGKRYYDPTLGRWLTTDPAGFIDSVNLYQYVFNNPFRYNDPDGQFVMLLPLLSLSWKVVAVAIVTAYVSYELEHQHRQSDSALARSFNAAAHEMVQHIGGLSQYALNQKLDTEKKKPPYSGEELGDDPEKCPGEGFEWKGKGPPGGKKGAWYNKPTNESLYPDLDHPPPKKPHWDYQGPSGEKARLNIDGTWEWK